MRRAVVFLPFHASILEPDLDLAFSQTELMSYLDATAASQVPVEVKLLLEFQRLMTRV